MEFHVSAGVGEAGRGILSLNISTQTVQAGPEDDNGSYGLDSLTVLEEDGSQTCQSGLGPAFLTHSQVMLL